MRGTITSIGFVAMFLSAPALAQNQMVIDKLTELNAEAPPPAIADIAQAVDQEAKRVADAKKTCAPTAIELEKPVPITGDRSVLNDVIARRLLNAWTIYAKQSGCAAIPEIVRYIVIKKADFSLAVFVVNHGRTNANPTLIRDTFKLAALGGFIAVKKLDSACDPKDLPQLLDMRIAEESADLGPALFGVRYTGTWSEIWRFRVCGRDADVKVDFRPDGDGGAYTNVPGSGVTIVPAK